MARLWKKSGLFSLFFLSKKKEIKKNYDSSCDDIIQVVYTISKLQVILLNSFFFRGVPKKVFSR